jgi:hypothetical protein
MLISAFDDREVELLILALRYWRSQRSAGHLRKTDPTVPPEVINQLLAKLRASTVTSLPSQGPPDRLPDLFRR